MTTETTAEGQATIAALREQLAEAEAGHSSLSLAPGDQIHFTRSGLVFQKSPSWGDSEISRRGQTVTLTAALIEASRDRDGRSWLALVDDEAAQIARWGAVTFARGPWPEGLPTWTPGTPEEDAAFELAHAAAWALPEGPERAEALRSLKATFGGRMTSVTRWQERDESPRQGVAR